MPLVVTSAMRPRLSDRARTIAGSSWRPSGWTLAVPISSRSSARSAIHLASTSSASGSLSPASGSEPSRKRTQYSLSSSPLVGVVGDQRAVRVDQIAVLALLERQQAEALVDLERLGAGGRAQQLAGPLLGAALARRVANVSASHQPPAACGKKITRSAAAGTSEKSRTMVASRLPPGPSCGTAAHMPRSSWRRNSCDEALLVLGHGGIALGEQHVALPRSHAKQLHGSIMPSTSTGPAPEPISRRPFATASAAIRRATRAASRGVSPSARRAASAEEWVQPEPWAAPSG